MVLNWYSMLIKKWVPVVVYSHMYDIVLTHPYILTFLFVLTH